MAGTLGFELGAVAASLAASAALVSYTLTHGGQEKASGTPIVFQSSITPTGLDSTAVCPARPEALLAEKKIQLVVGRFEGDSSPARAIAAKTRQGC